MRVLFVGHKQELGAVGGVLMLRIGLGEGLETETCCGMVRVPRYAQAPCVYLCTCACQHSPIMRWERVRGVRPRGGLKFLPLLEPNEFSECDNNGRRVLYEAVKRRQMAVMVLQQRNECTASAIDSFLDGLVHCPSGRWSSARCWFKGWGKMVERVYFRKHPKNKLCGFLPWYCTGMWCNPVVFHTSIPCGGEQGTQNEIRTLIMAETKVSRRASSMCFTICLCICRTWRGALGPKRFPRRQNETIPTCLFHDMLVY